MPGWYYEKKELRNTPSALDGIDYATERRYRKDGARLIISVGKKMVLGCNTVATGVVYYHRFYMFHSFGQFPRYVTACCCLFLAGKVEETPKKCKDIIKTARSLLSDPKFGTFGEDPKEEVMTLERILLQTIKFDLQVEHPYQYLVKYAKCFKGDKGKLEHMVEMAWTFVNDSLCTTLCLQWEPEIIAVALMYLAGKLSKFEVTDWIGRTTKHLRWWDMFVDGVTMDLLEDICHQVLDLYSQTDADTSDSPPMTPHKVGGGNAVPAIRPSPSTQSLISANAAAAAATSSGEKTLSPPDQPTTPTPTPTAATAAMVVATSIVDLPPPPPPQQQQQQQPQYAPPPPYCVPVFAPPPTVTAPPPPPPPPSVVFPYVAHHPPPPPFFTTSAPPPAPQPPHPHRAYYPPPPS